MSASKAVLITGASGGLGEALVTRLDELGFRVFAGVRDFETGERLARGSRSVVHLRLDVCDEASIARAEEIVAGELGPEGLHALVNSAGISAHGPLELVPLSVLRRQFEVNVIGQVAVTKAFLPLLRAARGRIVNIGGVAGRLAVPGLGPLSASRAALDSLSGVLRMELRHEGIHVSYIETGALRTRFSEGSSGMGRRESVANKGLSRALARAAWTIHERVRKGRVEQSIDAVIDALTASSPNPRYVIGRDAKAALLLLRSLPAAVRERLLDATTCATCDAARHTRARAAGTTAVGAHAP